MTEGEREHLVLLYDGVCGLCNRTVQFVLRRDRADVFRFAALQSALGRRILERHGANPSDLDTFYVVLHFDAALPAEMTENEMLLARSDAVIFVLRELDGVWRAVGGLFRLLPRAGRDWVYHVVVRHRYRIFGHYDSCPLPSEANQRRFLDL